MSSFICRYVHTFVCLYSQSIIPQTRSRNVTYEMFQKFMTWRVDSISRKKWETRLRRHQGCKRHKHWALNEVNVEHCGTSMSEVAMHRRQNAAALSYWASVASLLDILAWKEMEWGRTTGAHGGSNGTWYKWPAELATMYRPTYSVHVPYRLTWHWMH